DSRGYITINASQTLGSKDISFGLVTDWGHNLLKLTGPPFTQPGYETGNAQYIVQDVISPTLQVAFGIGGFFEIGASLPFRIISRPWGPHFVGDPHNAADHAQV